MRAIVVEKPGGAEVLQPREGLPVPKLKAGEVRVRVAYAGLNFFDVLQRGGRYLRKPKYPMVLGGEVSGVVDAVGADVHHLTEGQPVCALTGSAGGYAEYAVADAEAIIPLPHNMSLKLAAAYPLQVLTAWGVLNLSAKAHHPGEWTLVHAAAGIEDGRLATPQRRIVDPRRGRRGWDHPLPAGPRRRLPGDRYRRQR